MNHNKGIAIIFLDDNPFHHIQPYHCKNKTNVYLTVLKYQRISFQAISKSSTFNSINAFVIQGAFKKYSSNDFKKFPSSVDCVIDLFSNCSANKSAKSTMSSVPAFTGPAAD